MKKLVLCLILISGITISCQKSDSNSNTPAPVVVAPHQYNYNNGVCYDYTMNVNADPSFCPQPNPATNAMNNPNYYNNGMYNPNGMYNSFYNSNGRWLNGNCVNTAGQTIDQYYCLSQTYPGQCQGLYIQYYEYGLYTTYQCVAALCKGKTLIEYATGKQVVCQ